MKATIDPDGCVGCELCMNNCPEVFEMDEDVATVNVSEVPPHIENDCRIAAENCPVDAIMVSEQNHH